MKKLLLLFLPILLFSQKPQLLLLETYDDQNITGWVMSEKLDGIRAYWDGKNLISRGGKIIHAPKWFTKEYPPFEVDGELWSKRKDFENISSIVRDSVPSKKWQEIKHYIFEVPNKEGNLTQRLNHAKPYENRYLKLLPQLTIKSTDHLHVFLQEIEKKGGEGVVVRDPNSPYIAQRTNKALKVKTFHDAECEIVGHNEGKGKYKNLLGSFTCKLKNGTTFKIGSGLSDELRQNPPTIGSIITFKYQEFTKYEKPRFPVFLRVRDAK
ncbi:MAG: DNA ligase [Campylobacterota bacterium]|nr:DNA ligase [Campylobacterota bacterium]